MKTKFTQLNRQDRGVDGVIITDQTADFCALLSGPPRDRQAYARLFQQAPEMYRILDAVHKELTKSTYQGSEVLELVKVIGKVLKEVDGE